MVKDMDGLSTILFLAVRICEKESLILPSFRLILSLLILFLHNNFIEKGKRLQNLLR